MKRVLYLLGILLLAACSSSDEKSNDREDHRAQIAQKMIDAGIAKYISDSYNADSLLVSNFLDLYDPAYHRYVHIDAEELAEGSINPIVTALAKELQLRGISLKVALSHDFENDHTMIINNQSMVLFTDEELNDANYTFWETAPQNFFKRVNLLLERSRSDERCYLLYSGNDLSVMILTLKQMELFNELNKDDLNEQLRFP